MPFEDQAKVMANYMVAINQRETLVKNKQAVAKRDGEIQLAGLMQQLYAAPQGSPTQRAIQSSIVGLAQTVPGVVSDSTLKSILEPKQAKSDPMVEFNVITGILNGTITNADQVKGYIGRGLTGNDAVSALKLINSENRRDQSEIERGINRLAGINQTGGIVVLDKNAMEFTNRQQLKAQSLDIEARLLREGKQPTPAMVVSELEKFVTERRNSETAKQAVDALKAYEKKEWINGPVTMDSLAALERKAGTDRTRQNDVKYIRRLLQQANGMTQ
jgi:RNase H-fold protein (predicted Holliday junction resolvase)